MNATSENSLKKYHQAAYTYLVMGAVYLGVFFTTMPPHDFSLHFKIIIPILGVLFMGLAYFIYKGYRKFTLLLVVIYAIRVVVSIAALTFGEGGHVAVQYVLPVLFFTFYMLGRAVWDWRP